MLFEYASPYIEYINYFAYILAVYLYIYMYIHSFWVIQNWNKW